MFVCSRLGIVPENIDNIANVLKAVRLGYNRNIKVKHNIVFFLID